VAKQLRERTTLPVQSSWLTRATLAAWIIFLAFSVLRPAGADHAVDPERDAAAYAEVYVKPELTFPGYPLLPLDAVRNALSPWLHLSKRNFLAAPVFFLTVLVLALYLAGAQAGNESGGLPAALFASASPFILTVARVYDVHLPRLAAIALVLGAAAYFQAKKSTPAVVLLLSAWLAGLALCPATSDYLFFNLAIAGPLAVVLFEGVLIAAHRRRSLVAAAGLALAAAVATPFLLTYRGILDPVALHPPKLSVGLSFWDNPQAVWRQPAAALAYPVALWRAMLSRPLNAIVFLGFILLFFRPGPPRRLWAAGVFVPLLALILMPKRNMYYAANLLPALFLGAAAGWDWALRKIRRVALPALCLAAVLVSLAYTNQWLTPGRVEDPWTSSFVPGCRQYLPGIESLSLEPFGSVIGNEDLTARRLTQLLAAAPRPPAVGFLDRPCRRNITALELAYRGIFARDIVCSPPAAELPPYDAVIVMGQLASLAEKRQADDLLAVHRLMFELPVADAPPAPPPGGGTPPAVESLAAASRQQQALIEQAAPRLRDLAARYRRSIRVQDMQFFIASDDEALAEILTRAGSAPPAPAGLNPGYQE